MNDIEAYLSSMFNVSADAVEECLALNGAGCGDPEIVVGLDEVLYIGLTFFLHGPVNVVRGEENLCKLPESKQTFVLVLGFRNGFSAQVQAAQDVFRGSVLVHDNHSDAI